MSRSGARSIRPSKRPRVARCPSPRSSFVEASLIIESRYGPDGIRDLDLFIAKAKIEVVPVDAEQGHVARTAFRDYGKGRHRAGLNFGDCFAYALAKTLDEPLLFKGTDFVLTDIENWSPS